MNTEEKPRVLVQAKTGMTQTMEPAPVQAMSQADRLVEMAIQSGADIERLDKLLDLKERYEREEARKQFTAALAGFKCEDISITKDRSVSFPSKDGKTEYKHASLGNIIGIAVPFMSKHGLSHRWDVVQDSGIIHVTCILTHKGGHSEKVGWSAKPDESGKKNPIQQVASAITYLERYTFLAITGLAVLEMDDDARMAGKVVEPTISVTQIAIIEGKIKDAGQDMNVLLRWLSTGRLKIGRLQDIPASEFNWVMKKIDEGVKDATGGDRLKDRLRAKQATETVIEETGEIITDDPGRDDAGYEAHLKEQEENKLTVKQQEFADSVKADDEK